jgi:hypothetical protein
MTMDSRQSLEKLANITNALVVQMAELLKLRDAVKKAEEAAARKKAKQRHLEIISTRYRAKSETLEMEAQAKHRLATRNHVDAFSQSLDVPEHLQKGRIKNGSKKTKVLPGKLFMRSRWE